MKIRALQNILKTKYVVRNEDDNYLSIGPSFIHMLISVPFTGSKVYKCESWKLDGTTDYDIELTRVYRLIERMVDSKEILEYLTGADTLDDPLPVYSVKDGCIVEGFTDEYGWPNITDLGYLMYNNQFFSTPEAAI
jgi:hypothetical protein